MPHVLAPYHQSPDMRILDHTSPWDPARDQGSRQQDLRKAIAATVPKSGQPSLAQYILTLRWTDC
jgi:hypothetical protein